MLRYLLLKSFRRRKFISILCIFSMALSVSLFLTVEKVREGVENGFTNSISNADLIVGARSGSLQMLLYTIFHMGEPTNNISWKSYKNIKSNPMIDWTIPISLGDSYKGYRVVATDNNYLKYFQFHDNKHIEVADGKWFENKSHVVLGATVAKKLKHNIGDSIVLSHGITEDAIVSHDDNPFKISGILKATGTPIDKSVYISLAGMELIHLGWQGGFPSYDTSGKEFNEDNFEPKLITSFILRTKNRIALLRVQRMISGYRAEPLTAIIPGVSLSQLWTLLDQVEVAFIGVSFLTIIIGLLTILIILYMSLDQRKREFAILRSVGVSVYMITTLIVFESLLFTFLGAIFGIALQFIILNFIGPLLEMYFAISLAVTPSIEIQDLNVIGVCLMSGLVLSIIPSIKAYRSARLTNISAT